MNDRPLPVAAPDLCPACSSADVRVAVQGQSYPVYWCADCCSYFCRPPARVPAAPPVAAQVHEDASHQPSWRRVFGDVRVELHRHDARWVIAITDGSAQSLLRTDAEGPLEAAKAKAERLVGYSATSPWEAVA